MADKVSDHFYDGELPPDWVEKARRLKTDHGYMGKMDFPDRTDRLCRTIMATESYCSRESIIFAKEGTTSYRAPTIRELACFMGFPINYQFIGTTSTSKHKQIGNAVCVHLSMALARAIREKENIPLVPPPRRELVPFDTKLNINLNDLKTPLFANHVCAKEKKMNSKFHVHVPHLKIHQLRVELDNNASDFTNEQYVWRCLLHRGAGKGAKSTVFTAEQCRAILSSHPSFVEMEAFLEEEIRPRMLTNQTFQEKNCNIINDENERQLSPMELLEAISVKIKSMGLQNERLGVDTLDQQLEYSKKNEYSVEVLFALYMVNMAVSFLS
jgi:DNA (cytosine-5)-methyltransferase 1